MALPYFDNSVVRTTWWIWAVFAVALTAVVLVLYDFITFVAEHPRPRKTTDEEKGGEKGGKTTDEEKGGEKGDKTTNEKEGKEKIPPRKWAPQLSTGEIWAYIRAYIRC